ncbi:MAG TPA: type VII secretion target [Streptomyces sp.]|uniref:WXG100 family type VII secretion target n=1 Tax=Streptomyces sp. TaxID=1931 RepID=UPI002D71E81C|nr:type VII secretion target [Streptomyces sp.]HZG02886.1 type VII secretion target [Streptomyces sp.]
MGGRLNVERQELDRLLTRLHDSQDQMRKALKALRDIGPKSTGSQALDNACEEIHDSWDDAIGKIADGTDAIEKMLRSTKNNYEATERAIREAFEKARPDTAPGTAPTGAPSGGPSRPAGDRP